MRLKTTHAAVVVVLVYLALASPMVAQQPAATLSGTVTSTTGAVVPNAKISVKDVATGQLMTAESNSSGAYSVSNLAPGQYQVSVSAEGYASKTEQVTLATGAAQKLDVGLQTGSSTEPSLSELGFPASATQGNVREQALLDKRSHMLKVHQRLGLITAAPLLATVLTGSLAGGHSTSSSTRDLHAALGATSTVLYFTTASYAIFAPKLPDTPTRGPIRLHKALAWIHGPGMVLTPVLGVMAFEQKSRGERVHGIARLHAPVAYTTAIAYGAAILSVSLKF